MKKYQRVILKFMLFFLLCTLAYPRATFYKAVDEGGSFKIKRSGFKELEDDEKENPDNELVNMANERFANVNNGNYTGGKLGNKSANGVKNDNKKYNENDSAKSQVQSQNLGEAAVEKLDEMKKSGSKGNCKYYHIDGYKPNTAILYSVGSKYTIGIDAGHQQDASKYIGKGMSSGTSSDDGTPEYKITMEYANTCKDILLNAGYNVVMTRTENDADISNQNRGRLFATTECDMCIAFHTDSAGPGARGFTPCVSNWDPPNDAKAKAFAEVFRSKLASKSTGILTNRPIQTKDGYTLWSKGKGVPILLLEVGFINNPPDDWDLVKSQSYRMKFCEAVEEALEEYIGKPSNNHSS